VLTKPAIMSKKVFDTFIEDVEEVSRLNPGREGLEKFLQSKYFAHFSTATHTAVFKSVWRLVFKSSDQRCEANRAVNFLAMTILFAKQATEILRVIEDDRAWFSDVSFGEGHVRCLTAFFREHPQVFELLTDAVKGPIREYASGSLDHFALCWFLSDSPKAHVDEVSKRVKKDDASMSGGVFEEFCQSLKDTDAYMDALSVGVALYGKSPDFDAADARFDRMVRPFIADHSADLVKNLLVACEENSQTWSRKRAYADHREIQLLIESRFADDIDLKEFPFYRRSVTS